MATRGVPQKEVRQPWTSAAHAVLCVETGVIYPSMAAASRSMQAAGSHLSKYKIAPLKGNVTHRKRIKEAIATGEPYAGYHWRYATQEEVDAVRAKKLEAIKPDLEGASIPKSLYERLVESDIAVDAIKAENRELKKEIERLREVIELLRPAAQN